MKAKAILLAADGLTPATAWRTTERLNAEKLAPGSFVLFERGGVYRGGVKTCEGVTYTAYGVGAKPRVYASPWNGADPAKWEKTDAQDIWRCRVGMEDVGTIVFDGGRANAVKIVPTLTPAAGRGGWRWPRLRSGRRRLGE